VTVVTPGSAQGQAGTTIRIVPGAAGLTGTLLAISKSVGEEVGLRRGLDALLT
jgi:hypothetical protein